MLQPNRTFPDTINGTLKREYSFIWLSDEGTYYDAALRLCVCFLLIHFVT